MKYSSASSFEEQQVDRLQLESFNHSRQSKFSQIKGLSLNSSLLVLMICMLMISTTFSQRFGPQRLLQSSVIQDETFKTRVNCPYFYLNRSIQIINASNLTAAQKASVLANQHHLVTAQSKYSNHPNFNESRLYVIQTRSLSVQYRVSGSNETVNKKNLYYCGLSRSFYKTCQEDVRYTCTIPASMFETIRFQHIDVAFINLLDPSIIPDPWENGVTKKIPLCMDLTKEFQHCSMYEKKNPLQTYSDPLSIHNMESTQTHTTSGSDKQKDSLIHVRIMPDNWPLSPHIHGLQIRPTMDGHPESWISNTGLRGAGAFSSQDECFYNAFDTSDVYTTYNEPGDGNAPPPLIIKDKNGFDVTYLAKVNRYPNAQNPGTLWYHDHAMRLTNYNAISGLAGFYLIRDPVVQAQINVPKENEIFLLISGLLSWPSMAASRIRGGQVYRIRFLQDLPDSHHRIHFTHGSCANTSEASKIPFTLIGTDGSLFHQGIQMKQFKIGSGQRIQILIKPNANFTTFDLCSQQLQFHWLQNVRNPTTPGLNDPYVSLEDQLAANFTYNYPLNMSRVNNVSIPMAPARPGGSPYTGRTSINNVALSVSYQDLSLMPDSQIKAKKMRPLTFQQQQKEELFSIHYRSDFHKGFTQYSEIGTTQDYYFINLSNTPHPMHFHLVNFQVIKQYQLRTVQTPNTYNFLDNCSYYEVDFLVEAIKHMLRSQASITRNLKYHIKRIFRNNMQIVNIFYLCDHRSFFMKDKVFQKYLDTVFPQNAEPDPITKVSGLDLLKLATATDVLNAQSIYNITVGSYKYVTGAGTTRVRPEQSRWRDTVVVPSTRAFVYRVRWAKNNYNATAVPKDTYFNIPLDQLRQYPGFVYHCHIIHHEDYEMMRGFMMTLPKSLSVHQTLNQATPCNYNATTRQYAINWADKAKCINKRCNSWAKTQTANA